MKTETSTSNTLAQAAIAGLLALGLTASSGAAFAAAEKEKCFGVAMAGKNDCGGKYSKHSCAGTSTTDKDPNDWKYVEKGSCEKMGGKLKAAAELEMMKKKG
jgi:uncharacterized membrane protein